MVSKLILRSWRKLIILKQIKLDKKKKIGFLLALYGFLLDNNICKLKFNIVSFWEYIKVIQKTNSEIKVLHILKKRGEKWSKTLANPQKNAVNRISLMKIIWKDSLTPSFIKPTRTDETDQPPGATALSTKPNPLWDSKLLH